MAVATRAPRQLTRRTMLGQLAKAFVAAATTVPCAALLSAETGRAQATNPTPKSRRGFDSKRANEIATDAYAFDREMVGKAPHLSEDEELSGYRFDPIGMSAEERLARAVMMLQLNTRTFLGTTLALSAGSGDVVDAFVGFLATQRQEMPSLKDLEVSEALSAKALLWAYSERKLLIQFAVKFLGKAFTEEDARRIDPRLNASCARSLSNEGWTKDATRQRDFIRRFEQGC
ncbi:MAG: hypothetical protein ACKVPX_07730 [Myxococcaceae bacterium]